MKSPFTRSRCAAILLLAVVCSVQSLCPGHENACDRITIIPNAEYRGLNVGRSSHVAYCDSHFSGWYQFKHSNGTVLTIPESTRCHSRKMCGTEIPITLRHKETRNDGLKVYDGCFDYIRCCLFEIEVCSKVCENEVVYYLSSPFGCPIAYCTNHYQPAPCTVNQYRDEDSEECLDKYPLILSQNPRIAVGPDNSDETITFICTVIFDELNSARGNEVFEVQWIKNDQHVPSRFDRNISYRGARIETITYSLEANSNNSVPFTLKCRVRSFYEESRGKHSEWFCSNAFYAGLSVYPSSLEIFENSTEPVKIFVRPTIPIICSNEDGEGSANKTCALTVQIQNKKLMYQAPSACRRRFTRHNWYEVQSFTLNSVPDMINTKENNPMKILVELLKQVVDDHDYFPSQWFAYAPTQIKAYVQDAPAIVCQSVNDPRTFPFDSKNFFSYYGTGDFLLAKSNVNNLEVQIRLWECNDQFNANSLFSCNCGVAIREGNNVVSVGQCVAPSLPKSTFLQVVRNSKSVFSNGFRVFRNQNQVRVVLSTGSFVDIFGDTHGINVHLHLSPIYANKTKGLCGNSNGLSGDDFIGRDGEMHDSFDETLGHADFSETWRLSDAETLFEKVGLDYSSTETEATDVLRFCECENSTANSTCYSDEIADVVVGPHNDSELNLIPESEFTQVAVILANPGRVAEATRKKRLAEQRALNKRETISYGWPTKSNITKEMAEKQCQNDLEQTSVALACKREGIIREVDSQIIKACVEDIKVTDDLSWPRSYVRTVQENCENVILKNSSYWKEQLTQNTNNQSFSNETFSLADKKPSFPRSVQRFFCPNNCSGKGTCENSKCVCPKGFSGDDCSVNLAKPPQASHFNTGPLCDVNTQPCTTLHVIGSGFYNHPSLACVIQVQGSRRILKIKAKYQSTIDLTCRIPNNIFRQNGTAYVPLTVKVAAGGNVSREEIRYTVHNATCYECDEDANCFLKNGTCNIKGKCIEENDFIESNKHCRTCQPAYSTSKWKVTKKKELCPTLATPQNGFVQVTSFGSGLKAKYSCSEGGYVLKGQRSRTCNLTNACNRHVHWSRSTPSCVRARVSLSDRCREALIAAGLLSLTDRQQNLACKPEVSERILKCEITANLIKVTAECVYSGEIKWTVAKKIYISWYIYPISDSSSLYNMIVL